MQGKCGVLFPEAYSGEPGCEPIVQGELDESCLDSIVGGQRMEGCRRTDGRCGHLTPGWGCHRVFRYLWDWELNDADPSLPNPFECTPYEAPCTRTTQCCFHPNYGGLCVPAPDQDLDASVDELEGICDDDDGYFGDKTPFPRF